LEGNVWRFQEQHKPRAPFGVMDCPEAVDTWERLLEQASREGTMLVPTKDKKGSWQLPVFSAMEDDAQYPAVFPAHVFESESGAPGYLDLFSAVFERWAWKEEISLKPSPEDLLQRCAILSLSAALALRGFFVDMNQRLQKHTTPKTVNSDSDGGEVPPGFASEGDPEILESSLAPQLRDLIDDISSGAQPLLAEQSPTTVHQRLRSVAPSALFPDISTDDVLFTAWHLDMKSEFNIQPSTMLTQKDTKRPVNIINITNYGGKRLSKLLVRWLAYRSQADVVRIDAMDLSRLVGGYLGQDWAYSKGPISMLGFRIAELNGTLDSPFKWPRWVRRSEDHEDDEESGLRQFSSYVRTLDLDDADDHDSLLRELAKIKDDPMDYELPSTDKWEDLKIDKALESIVRDAMGTQRPLIVHVDDFVELNMTIEGSVLVGRLRKIVDDLWLRGHQVIMVGTTSVETLSPTLVESLQDLSLEDHVNLVEANRGRSTPWSQIMSDLDYLQRNLTNAQTLLATIAGSGNSLVSEQQAVLNEFIRQIQAILRYHNATAHFPPGTPDMAIGREQWRMIQSHLKALLEDKALHENYDAVTTGVLGPTDLLQCAKAVLAASTETSRPWPLFRAHFRHRQKRVDHANAALNVNVRPVLQVAGEASETDAARSIANKTPTQLLIEKLNVTDEHEKKLLSGIIDTAEIKTTFKDVHAPPETISALKLLTSLSLKRPDAFSYGVLARDRIPGCLLYGPPGTGKTLLAKAVAKECGASMLEVSAASINDMWLGQGEKNVQAIFSLAKKMAPLVVFIDEADALLAARSDTGRGRSHREVINQFLREWDGMSETNAFVMVATNRPFDLDDAVLRRLPRKILVDLPQLQDRRAILDILLRDEQLAPDVDLDALAKETPLHSGSDLKNICVAAAMAAVREEVDVADRHATANPQEPYVYPEKRTLENRHFVLARREIGASVSDDMNTMREIRKFDQTYGKPGRKKGRALGFGVVGQVQTEASIRQAEVGGAP
jgi:ATP-dependent 26S proteasome regulatory subunit